jgi:hypothetical protein
MTAPHDLSDVSDAELLRIVVLGDAAYKEAERRRLIKEKAPKRGPVRWGGNQIDL